MKALFAAMFAVMIGLTFVGSTFADEKKDAAPAGEMKNGEGKKDKKDKKEKKEKKAEKAEKEKAEKAEKEKAEKK